MPIILRIVNVLIPVLIGVTGQLFLKFGMTKVGAFGSSSMSLFEYFYKSFTNIPVLIGFSLYFISSLFWMIVLSKEQLSFAYPLLAIGYIVVIIASILIFKETVSLVRWLGVMVIIMGVILISRS